MHETPQPYLIVFYFHFFCWDQIYTVPGFCLGDHRVNTDDYGKWLLHISKKIRSHIVLMMQISFYDNIYIIKKGLDILIYIIIPKVVLFLCLCFDYCLCTHVFRRFQRGFQRIWSCTIFAICQSALPQKDI